jgi:hypothetical protein
MQNKNIWVVFLLLLIGLSIAVIVSVAAEIGAEDGQIEQIEPMEQIEPIELTETTDKQGDVVPEAVTILKDADWVHGTQSVVEFPSSLFTTYKKGWGTTYVGKNNTFNWFHFAIPTTVISDGSRNQITKAFVLFKTDGNARITNVHVWDGPTKIKAYDGLSLSGDHSNVIDSSTAFAVGPRYVSWGIGISVGVDFGQMNAKGIRPSILLTTAGADLYQ